MNAKEAQGHNNTTKAITKKHSSVGAPIAKAGEGNVSLCKIDDQHPPQPIIAYLISTTCHRQTRQRSNSCQYYNQIHTYLGLRAGKVNSITLGSQLQLDRIPQIYVNIEQCLIFPWVKWSALRSPSQTWPYPEDTIGTETIFGDHIYFWRPLLGRRK
jgi:hypothetical protein